MTGAKKAMSIVGFSNDGGRPENDFYPTPPEVTRALLKVEAFPSEIWEPACGNGAMSKVLEQAGYPVVSTDLEPRDYGEKMDFLYAHVLLAENIVTNPPFKIAQQFAMRALDLGCLKLALLCKLQFLEGQERSTWLRDTPLQTVHVFQNRISMGRNGVKYENGGMMAFAWFVWEKGYDGKPQIDWIQT